jgi:putative oxidoreductase
MSRLLMVLYHLARLALALVFIYAGAVKMQNPVAFAGQVAAYRILPYAMNYLVAVTLPYIEFLAGVLLFLNLRVRPALVVIGAMTACFMAALVSALARGLEIDCGCFDPAGGSDVTAGVALMRDGGLVALMALIWWLRGRTPVRPAGSGTPDDKNLS